MYAQLKDSQLINMINGTWLGNIANPTAAQLSSENYYPVAEIPLGKIPISWELSGQKLIPITEDSPKSPRSFSKFKLVYALTQLSLWPYVKSWIDSKGMTDLYLACQVIEEDNPYFQASLSQLSSALSCSPDLVNQVLSSSVYEY